MTQIPDHLSPAALRDYALGVLSGANEIRAFESTPEQVAAVTARQNAILAAINTHPLPTDAMFSRSCATCGTTVLTTGAAPLRLVLCDDCSNSAPKGRLA